MQELNNILRDLNNGHTHIVSLDHFEWYYSAYGSKNSWKGNKPWEKVLNDPIVLNRYKFDTSKKKKQLKVVNILPTVNQPLKGMF